MSDEANEYARSMMREMFSAMGVPNGGDEAERLRAEIKQIKALHGALCDYSKAQAVRLNEMQAEIARIRSAMNELAEKLDKSKAALAEISNGIDCNGDCCQYCTNDLDHPPSREALVAQEALSKL